jgi:hypothetical protein
LAVPAAQPPVSSVEEPCDLEADVDPLFTIPDDLSELSDDELRGLLEQSVATVRAIREDAATVRGERSDAEFLAELTAGVDGIKRIEAALLERAEAAASARTTDEQVADLTAGIGDEPDASEEEETVEGEVVDEPSGELDVIADDGKADQLRIARERLAAIGNEHVPAKHRPVVKANGGKPVLQPVFAAGDIPGMSAGQQFEDRDQLIEAMTFKHLAVGKTESRTPIKYTVARIQKDLRDDAMVSDSNSGLQNWRQLEKVIGGPPGSKQQVERMGGTALTADGGLCAPLTPKYDIPVFGVTDSPVRSSLPNVPAPRGGIRFFPPMPWNTGANAIGAAITSIDESPGSGGSTATKTYQTITCPTDQSAYVTAWAKRVRIENLKGRTWPELVDAFLANLDVAYASSVEISLLNAIATALPNVTIAPFGGVLTTLVPALTRLTAAVASRQRLDPETRFRLLAPAWLPDMMESDSTRNQFDRWHTEAELMAQLDKADIDLTYYLDSATGAGQIFGAQSANAAVTGWPSTTKFYLYPEGSFVLLEHGAMDLGIVRDSTLNELNEYEMFLEEWIGIAYIGAPEAYEITATLVDDGLAVGLGYGAHEAITTATGVLS